MADDFSVMVFGLNRSKAQARWAARGGSNAARVRDMTPSLIRHGGTISGDGVRAQSQPRARSMAARGGSKAVKRRLERS